MAYYKRRLPHWQPEGAAIFLTWRLRGSLPKELFESLPTTTPGKAFVLADRELDQAGVGPRWLQDDPRVAQAVVETLRFGQDELKLYALAAWVIMANHVHILISPEAPVARIMKSIKNYSALRANEILGRRGEAFWQRESYDHWVRGALRGISNGIRCLLAWWRVRKAGLGRAAA